MRSVDIIQKTRNGEPLSSQEINEWIELYCKGEIPDYQMSAWIMAVYFKGMTAQEVAALTTAMANSGDQVDLSAIHGTKVDKHSTGGVGDKTSLILAPLVAAAGVPVAKMSGRGLGHTGGTIDKLESIPGFHTERTQAQFVNQVNTIGVAIIGQSGDLAPADKQLYALRDVTATVESIPLISSSIMSKKIAAGADAIVLDVKSGDGAFMKTLDDSIALAKTMVAIGTETGRETAAVISDMDQPLGFAIGNALEVEEAIQTLKGAGPADLTELCIVLGAHMVMLGRKAATFNEARTIIEDCLQSGKALNKFREFINAQGGDGSIVDDPAQLPKAANQVEVRSEEAGYVSHIAAEQLGIVAMRLGAGRETKEMEIDHAVGIVIHKKVGDLVQQGDVLATLHTNQSQPQLNELIEIVQSSYTYEAQRSLGRKLILATVTKDEVIEH